MQTRNKLVGLLLLTIASFAGHAFAQSSLYPNNENLRSDTFDILKTTINLELGSLGSPTITGNAQLRFAPKLNNRTFIRFDLLKMVVDSVKENNSLRTFTYNDTILKVNFALPKNTTDTSVFIVYYHGTPVIDATGWGGFYFDNTQNAEYAYNLGVGFGAKPHNYGRVWYPCFDNFAERCKFEFNITSDTARRAYCNGVLASDVVNGLKRTRKWVLNQEIPSYLASVSLAKYSEVNWSVNTLNGVKPIKLIANAADTTALKNGFVNLKSCINGFENYFGPYQWPRFGYCVVPFNSGAMEHATNITYPRPFIGNLAYESDLMAHELSHHWWGDLLTCETPEDMWINEGMATFSSYMFLEWQYGKTRYLDKVKSEHDGLLHFLFKKEGFRPISGVPHNLTYGTHVYVKGADVAHTLRGYMGDTAFFNACKYVMQQKAYKNMNSVEMRNLFQTSSGQNLSDFFNGWVFGPGWPHFAVDSVSYLQTAPPGNVIAVIYIKQKLFGATSYFNNVPLELSFFKNDWSRVVKKIVVSGATSSATVTLPFMPAMYALNFDAKISDATSHEAKSIKSTGTNNYVLGKVFLTVLNSGQDSSLVRITHNYVKPDPFKSNTGGHRLSNQHFWKVEGIFSPGFKAKARFNYDGSKSITGTYSYLDTSLVIYNGDSLGLFYRSSAAADWSWLNTGFKIKTNTKIGSIEIDSLMPGEYCFGNVGDTSTVSLSENIFVKGLRIFPNPGKGKIKIVFHTKPQQAVNLRITNIEGKKSGEFILRESNNELDLHLLTPGAYLFEFSDQMGKKQVQKVIIN